MIKNTFGLSFGNIVPHKFSNDLGGRSIFSLTGIHEGASQLLVDPDLECNVFPSHCVSVPIVHPFGQPT